MNVTFKEEDFSSIYEEILPLFEENHKESGVFPDKIELEVAKEFYDWANVSGTVHVLVGRDEDEEGRIACYCITFLNHHPHYESKRFAINDVIYVHPEYRKSGVALEMIQKVEEIARSLKVDVMSFHTKVDNPSKSLMEKAGFEPAEIQYFKYLEYEV